MSDDPHILFLIDSIVHNLPSYRLRALSVISGIQTLNAGTINAGTTQPQTLQSYFHKRI